MRLLKKARLAAAILVLGGVGAAVVEHQITRISNPAHVSRDPDGLAPGGDRHNSYAWCMERFQTAGTEWVYVGSNRDLLRTAMLGFGLTDPAIEQFFAGDVPTGNIDYRARIFRYRADGTGAVEQTFVSPTFAVGLPLDVGYRGMASFNGDLYVVSYGNPLAYSRVLRFPAAGGPPVEVLRVKTNSLRAISVHDGQLCIGTQENKIYLSSNPQTQPPANLLAPDSAVGWTQVAADSDLGNDTAQGVGVWELESFNGELYASLGQEFDPARINQGFRLYRGRNAGVGTPGANAQGWLWTPVIETGLSYGPGLGNSNNAAASLEPFNGSLYLGTFMDVPNQAFKRTIFNNFNPCQIYRLNTTGTIDMVVGDTNAQFPTRTGNFRAGFHAPSTAQLALPSPQKDQNLSLQPYLWWMETHNGRLYVSTFDVKVLLRYVTAANLTAMGVLGANQPAILALVDQVRQLNDNPEGFDIYVSEDGNNFQPVTRDGFGDPFNYGGRTLFSTQPGLLVGTANPFYGCQLWRLSEVPTPTASPTAPQPPQPIIIPEDGGAACFVATAAYGTPMAPQIGVLRKFRDHYLIPNKPGQAFVSWYYRNGPVGAAYLQEHPALKPLVRVGLMPAIAFAWLALNGGLGVLLCAGLALALVARRKGWLKRKVAAVTPGQA